MLIIKKNKSKVKKALGEKTKITISFKGKNQIPLFLIIKEFWKDGEVIYAEILFEIDYVGKEKRK